MTRCVLGMRLAVTPNSDEAPYLGDLVARLVHAGANEFGLTIQMLLFALEEAMLRGAIILIWPIFRKHFGEISDVYPL